MAESRPGRSRSRFRARLRAFPRTGARHDDRSGVLVRVGCGAASLRVDHRGEGQRRAVRQPRSARLDRTTEQSSRAARQLGATQCLRSVCAVRGGRGVRAAGRRAGSADRGAGRGLRRMSAVARRGLYAGDEALAAEPGVVRGVYLRRRVVRPCGAAGGARGVSVDVPGSADASQCVDVVREAGFCFVHAETMRLELERFATLADWAMFAASWDALGPDPYLERTGRARRRRHGVFRWAGGVLTREPHQPHFQSLAYNSLQGDVDRWFEPILPEVGESASLRAVLRFACAFFGALAAGVAAWRIEVHQFRIEARLDTAGEP